MPQGQLDMDVYSAEIEKYRVGKEMVRHTNTNSNSSTNGALLYN